MNAQPKSTHPSFFSHLFSRAASIAIALTSLVAACDAESLEEPSDEEVVVLSAGEELDRVPAESVPSAEDLMESPEAATLQVWLESQGYAMVSSDVELAKSGSEPNAIVHFTQPGSEDLIGAAIAFRLSESGEILEVAAVIADEPDSSDPADIDTCLSPAVYHATSGAVEITMAPQAAECVVGIFGCGRCLVAGGCAGQHRESYYWGIKFNTCDSCGGMNPNGCCGCLAGYNC